MLSETGTRCNNTSSSRVLSSSPKINAPNYSLQLGTPTRARCVFFSFLVFDRRRECSDTLVFPYPEIPICWQFKNVSYTLVEYYASFMCERERGRKRGREIQGVRYLTYVSLSVVHGASPSVSLSFEPISFISSACVCGPTHLSTSLSSCTFSAYIASTVEPL